MRIIDRGNGPPLVLVPGLQGRWEYVRPTVDALAQTFRVLSFSLCDEPTAKAAFDPRRGFDNYVDQIRAALDDAGVSRAAICGISFGGAIALRFAAAEPERCEKLILVSTPRPGFHLRKRHEIYARIPWLFGPLFLIETPRRALPEVRAALPDSGERRRFARWALTTLLAAPLSPSRMAARARLLVGTDLRPDCERVVAPTLVMTGEPGLDFVVPVDGSCQYAQLIPGARHVVLPRTGHQGPITRPDEFARIVRDFVAGNATRWPHAAA
jgi:pimeloyl-ACP methyl ester carboxylesterase